jgi:CelD/BcsL family acetyltransferase involved in cellulose biosynthesis
MSIETLKNWNDVKLYYSDWRKILDAAPLLTVFSTPEWLEAWWESYGAGASLNFLLLRDGAGTIICMLPLYIIVADSFVGKLRLARWVGDGSADSDNLEFICLPGREDEAVQELLRWLDSSSCCNLCQLNTLPFPSILSVAFSRQVRPFFWVKTCSYQPRIVVNLAATWDEYLKRLSRNEREQIGRKSRRLEKEFTTAYFRITSPDDLYPSLEKLFQLHQKRWALRNEPGSFSVPERRTFYQKFAAEFLRQGWLEFWFLELNKVQVAAQFAFVYRGVAYILQEGFDPDYSSNSVGYVLRSHVLRRMIEAGVRKYDFLGGESASKLRWAGVQSQYLDIHVAPRFGRGGVFLVCRKMILTCKNFVRHHLPAKMLDTFKVLSYRNAQKSAKEAEAMENISASAESAAQLQPVRLSPWS